MQTRRHATVLIRYHIEQELLRRMVEIDRKTRDQCAIELGVPVHAVDIHCSEYGISSGRKSKTHNVHWTQQMVDDLRNMIEVEKIPLAQAALRLGVSRSSVEKASKKFSIKTQPRGPRKGSGHWCWNGGRIQDKDGYILIYLPGHPMARSRGNSNEPVYVLEHRFVMSEHLGRILEDNEVVHHVNGDKTDNRIENLQLFEANSLHLKHELTGRVPRWTEDGLRRIRQGHLKFLAQKSNHQD